MGRRERKKQQTRQRIVESAFELFDAHGFATTTVGMIADAAGVSPRTVFRYFGRKEDIVFARTDEAIDALVDRIAARFEREPRLSALAAAFIEHLDQLQATDALLTRGRLIRENRALAERAVIWRHETAHEIADELATRDGATAPTLEHLVLAHTLMSLWSAVVAHGDFAAEDVDPPTLLRRAADIAAARWSDG